MNNNFTQSQGSQGGNFGYIYKICEQHPGCKECPLVSGKSLIMAGDKMQCLTGMNKKDNEEKVK